MPHSLRVKIKGLRYKGMITEKDCDRLCKSLDNEDVLDKIRNKIYEDYLTAQDDTNSGDDTDLGIAIGLKMTLDTIDKYMKGDDR